MIRGSLLVIPCGQALLYAEPIYLQAAQSPMPELRLVVLALQDRLAYGPTQSRAELALWSRGAVAYQRRNIASRDRGGEWDRGNRACGNRAAQ